MMRRVMSAVVNRAQESEKSLERYLCARCKAAGLLCLKYTSVTQCGYPDRIVLLPEGRCVWVELKSAGCVPNALQRMRHGELRRLGQYVYVCDSRELVDELIEDLLL